MFDLINGTPLHPLVVHAVVVLLPLATLGTIAISLRSARRLSYGPLVVAAAVLSTLLIPVGAALLWLERRHERRGAADPSRTLTKVVAGLRSSEGSW